MDKETATLICTFFTTCFTGVLAYYACKGVNTWKKQLRGRHDFNFIREILLVLREVRNHYSNLSNYEHNLTLTRKRIEKNGYLTQREKMFFQVISEDIKEFASKNKIVAESASRRLKRLSFEGEVLFNDDVGEDIRKMSSYFHIIAEIATYESSYFYNAERDEDKDIEQIKEYLAKAEEWAVTTRKAHDQLFADLDICEQHLKNELKIS